MRFTCISTRTGSATERMERDVIINLSQNSVSDTGLMFRNGQQTSGGTFFVQTAPGGARWGITLADGETGAEFRLASDALTYGFFAAGALQASGPCRRTQ